jgi:hypothetical protein
MGISKIESWIRNMLMLDDNRRESKNYRKMGGQGHGHGHSGG